MFVAASLHPHGSPSWRMFIVSCECVVAIVKRGREAVGVGELRCWSLSLPVFGGCRTEQPQYLPIRKSYSVAASFTIYTLYHISDSL